jgi:hypothetical protein
MLDDNRWGRSLVISCPFISYGINCKLRDILFLKRYVPYNKSLSLLIKNLSLFSPKIVSKISEKIHPNSRDQKGTEQYDKLDNCPPWGGWEWWVINHSDGIFQKHQFLSKLLSFQVS